MSSLFLEFYLKIMRVASGAVKIARGHFGPYRQQSLHVQNVLLSQVVSLQDLKLVTSVCS